MLPVIVLFPECSFACALLCDQMEFLLYKKEDSFLQSIPAGCIFDDQHFPIPSAPIKDKPNNLKRETSTPAFS